MGCATSIVKYLLFFFNLIVVLAAIAFIAIGVVFKLTIDDVTQAIEIADSHFSLAPTLLIIVGCLIFLIAFFGCCGAIRESTCMLSTYAIILLTLFILQVALGVYAFLQFKDSDTAIKDEITRDLKATFDRYSRDDLSREAVDTLQYGLSCCGINRPDDWRTYWQNSSAPASCCPNKPPNCQQSNAFQVGCAPTLFDFVHKSIKIVGIVVISVAAVELGGAIVALCLASSIRNHARRGNYA